MEGDEDREMEGVGPAEPHGADGKEESGMPLPTPGLQQPQPPPSAPSCSAKLTPTPSVFTSKAKFLWLQEEKVEGFPAT